MANNEPIYFSENIVQAMAQEIISDIRRARVVDGTLRYTKSVDYGPDDNRKVTVGFTAEAYLKMIALVNNFTTEIAWHGTVERISPTEFLITDILVYPQTVSASTVNTDQEEYQIWMNELDDDTFNSLRFQGHSHVNFNATPSPTDLGHQSEIVSTFNKDEYFYIFMIINKKLEFDVRVYDMASNTLFKNEHVDVVIAGANCNFESFIADAKKMIEDKKTSYTPNYPYSGAGSNAYSGSAYDYWNRQGGETYGKGSSKKSDSKKSAGKKDKQSKSKEAEELFPDDDADGYEYPSFRHGSIWDDVQS